MNTAIEAGGAKLIENTGLAAVSLGVLAILGLLAIRKVGFVGMAIWIEATYPQAIAQMTELYRTKGRKCVLVGLVDLLAGLLLVLVLLNAKVLGILGILLFLALCYLVIMGAATAYLNLGLRLSANGAYTTQTKAMLKGGIAAECAFLVPILGQLLALGMLLRGTGAVGLTLLSRARRRQAQMPTAAPTAESAPNEAPPTEE